MSPRLLSRWALGATLALVTLGGFTRGSGSGYGCEDRWPLCEGGLLGGLLPRLEFEMIVEWSHRWLAAVVGLLAVATAVMAWRRSRRWVAWVAIAAVLVIGVQAWVGRLIVANALDADLVSLHLAISMTVASLLTVVAVATSAVGTPEASPRWAMWLGAGVVVAAGTLYLGSLVHNLYIPGWPLTLGEVVPNLAAPAIAQHFFHRVLAAVGFALTGWLWWRAWRTGRPRAEVWATGIGFGSFAVNVGLGAAHVFTMVSWSGLVAAHLGIASIALVSLVAATTMATDSGQQTANS